MKFYVIDYNVDSREFSMAEAIEPINTYDWKYCESCGGTLGLKEWAPPYHVKFLNSVFSDFVFVDYLDLIVSKKFKMAYEITDLKGITNFNLVEEIKLRRKKNIPKLLYYKVDIIRSKTRINERKSKFKREFSRGQSYCKVCQIGGTIKSMKGVYIDLDTWTGEDIFYALGLPGAIFVTQKFANFFEENQFTNVILVEAENYKPSFLLKEQ